ncbi:MAG TPA: zinc ribbon domain-containing protein [Ktedonobacteraceae bacterium]|nr:zinc ribbon domain-containing protein [Ktedonobacteraceae bacterium]
MALIACPDCGKDVSDLARSCPYCGLPVAAYLQQKEEERVRIEEEKEAERVRIEEEAEQQRIERQKQNVQGFLVAAGIIAFFFIVAIIASSQDRSRVVLQLMNQMGNVKPGTGTYAFSANGMLKLDYSCQSRSRTKNTETVQFLLVNSDSKAVVWKKALVCSISGSERLQVEPGSYDIGVSVDGNVAWAMTISQV